MSLLETSNASITSGLENELLFRKEASSTETCSVSSASADALVTSATCTSADDDIESIHVKFQNIEIRNYQMTMGDNPAVSYGPPVSLDWEYDEADIVDLDDYEESRGARRKSYQMQMNARYRKQLLDELNFTPDEVEQVIQDMKKIKKGRERTKMMLPFWKLEDAAESAKRKTKRAMV